MSTYDELTNYFYIDHFLDEFQKTELRSVYMNVAYLLYIIWTL
jgi:hypothetical protein